MWWNVSSFIVKIHKCNVLNEKEKWLNNVAWLYNADWVIDVGVKESWPEVIRNLRHHKNWKSWIN